MNNILLDATAAADAREESPLSDVNSDASTELLSVDEEIQEEDHLARDVSSDLSNAPSSALSDLEDEEANDQPQNQVVQGEQLEQASAAAGLVNGLKRKRESSSELSDSPSANEEIQDVDTLLEASTLPLNRNRKRSRRQETTEEPVTPLLLDPIQVLVNGDERKQEEQTDLAEEEEFDTTPQLESLPPTSVLLDNMNQHQEQDPPIESAHEATPDMQPIEEVELEGEQEAQEVEDEIASAEESAEEEEEEVEIDDAAIKARTKAIEALFQIEVQFAQLRDRLYVERMEQVAKERDQVDSGSHPELVFLNEMIEKRRETKLNLAQKWLVQLEQEYLSNVESQDRVIWSAWEENKSALSRDMLDEITAKRRTAEREQRMSERLRDDRLAAILAGHADRRTYQYQLAISGRPYSEEELAWAFRKQAVPREYDAGLFGLEQAVIQDDLDQMSQPLKIPSYSSVPVFRNYPRQFSPEFGPSTLPLGGKHTMTDVSSHHANLSSLHQNATLSSATALGANSIAPTPSTSAVPYAPSISAGAQMKSSSGVSLHRQKPSLDEILTRQQQHGSSGDLKFPINKSSSARPSAASPASEKPRIINIQPPLPASYSPDFSSDFLAPSANARHQNQLSA